MNSLVLVSKDRLKYDVTYAARNPDFPLILYVKEMVEQQACDE